MSEYRDSQGQSSAYKEFEKDLLWMDECIGPLARFLKSEYDVEQIELKAYIIEVHEEIHNCYKIKSKYNNAALDYHEHGVNGAYYSIYPIRPGEYFGEDIRQKQGSIARCVCNDIVNSMPASQMAFITQVQPHFITQYTIDSGPYLCVQMEIDLPAVRKSEKGSGVYGDISLSQQKEFPFFPFQPIFAGKDKESALIIIPRTKIFDIDKFRENIAYRLDTGKEKVRFKSLYNLRVDIEQLPWSVGPHIAHNIRIKYSNPKEINAGIAEQFLSMSENDIRIIQSAGGALNMKGRKDKEISEGIRDKFLNLYGKITGDNLYNSIFGSPKERIYIDPFLADEINEMFQKEKKRRLKRL